MTVILTQNSIKIIKLYSKLYYNSENVFEIIHKVKHIGGLILHRISSLIQLYYIKSTHVADLAGSSLARKCEVKGWDCLRG